jgi:hypothetical protein
MKDIILFVFCMSVLLFVLFVAPSRQCRDEESAEVENANSAAPSPPKGWDAKQEKHHRSERIFWFLSAVGSIVAAAAAGCAAYFASEALVASQQAAKEAKRQADAADRQATIANEDRRPWVSLQPSIVGPLHFINQNTAQFAVKFDVSNSGRTPALNAFLKPLVKPATPQRSAPQLEQYFLVDELRKKNWDSMNVGAAVIFPNQSLSRIWTITVPDVGEDLAQWTNAGVSNPGFTPMFTACIVYRFTFSDDHHLTCVVGTIQPKGGFITRPFEIGKDVDADKIEIALIFGGYVD